VIVSRIIAQRIMSPPQSLGCPQIATSGWIRSGDFRSEVSGKRMLEESLPTCAVVVCSRVVQVEPVPGVAVTDPVREQEVCISAVNVSPLVRSQSAMVAAPRVSELVSTVTPSWGITRDLRGEPEAAMSGLCSRADKLTDSDGVSPTDAGPSFFVASVDAE
jgi:hypothetical protein